MRDLRGISFEEILSLRSTNKPYASPIVMVRGTG